ncbi:MAG: 1-deoxy-D-xylulose-5-phosphate synthase [Longimicrobiales bacterium]|nr:1-deoxy-D-xylulose-5-phosphate synthase [Longimicrobiales bacterium]
MALLDLIQSPKDLRRLDPEQLVTVAREVRERHIDVVSQIGGHFGASLGVVELTVALHYAFDTPRDKLVWDTGHQGYIHKILTGRNAELPSIRQRHGLAPFLRRDESEYDAFGAGHASTSISAAWGMAVARDLNEAEFSVAAIIGDGAMGCGLAYEALNNAGSTDRDFIVVLNDNDHSIAPNVGALNKYLTSVVTNPAYNRVRDLVKDVLHRAPTNVGHLVEEVAGKLEDGLTHFLTPGMLFEAMGFRYVGPLDGHDVVALADHLERVRGMKGPILVHAITQKGKGFALAEDDPWTWHASGPFDKVSGSAPRKSGSAGPSRPRYQKVFGRALVDLAREDERVVTITAGMPDGTSTDLFAKEIPERYFDVGIAEGHGVTFAAGLATEKIRPVVAIYSTFLQRGYDMIVHDVALQDLPVVFAMDRAGVAGADGPTHHGALDISYMLGIPNMTVTAGKDGREMIGLLRTGIAHEDGPYSVRWPRANVPDDVPETSEIEAIDYGTWEVVRRGSDIALLAVGTMVLPALDAAHELAARGIDATVVNCRFLKPYDAEILDEVLAGHAGVVTIEEGALINGFGAFMAREIAQRDAGHGVHTSSMGLPDRFIEHGDRDGLLAEIGLDARGIADHARAFAERIGAVSEAKGAMGPQSA